MFNIGCSLPAQVGIVTYDKKNANNNITISQGLKTESSASIVNDNRTTAEVTNHSEKSLQNKMSHDNNSGWMEVEDSMLSPQARVAKESRRLDLEEARRAALANLDPSNLARDRQPEDAGQRGPQGDGHQMSPSQIRTAASSSQGLTVGGGQQNLPQSGGTQ